MLFFTSRVCRVAIHGTAVFRPHVHKHPCVVCDAAAMVAKAPVVGVTPCEKTGRHEGRLLDSTSSSSSGPFGCITETVGHSTSLGCAEYVAEGCLPTTSLTVHDSRKLALEQWLEQGLDKEACRSPVKDAAFQQRCWDAFCDPSRTLEDDEVDGVVDFLDKFCEVRVRTEGVDKERTKLPPARQPSCAGAGDEWVSGQNAFLVRLKADAPVGLDLERQLRFQRVLLDFREVVGAVQLPFFLSAGTALAAHRERYFIPHDTDIDVGVFYEDLQQCSTPTPVDCASEVRVGESEAQATIVRLLSTVAMDGRFVLFDICGTVGKGLEMRFLHSKTEVSLDLNVYYPPLQEDETLVAQGGAFVWMATYYEAAAERRHAMYRYRHAPFRNLLRRVDFCDTHESSSGNQASCSGRGFLVPPQSYVAECYGADWQTPRRFNYTEGLREGLFKNIIVE
ncbi:putative LicD family [Trypanosoma vivax]|uniref:LicD/FKTN/FKRP nucleotidyltransferase domain-containing protein n=1 Tax=Trypanosoma vivax (strain Y486) TaxID=1055687 RepID=G0U8W5_TRYVY|nr:hypothetical protein TRVL_00688 [Trypanosoma vivax]KAH8603353.1 putative LicD family [Trypanosoma vivax]CCC54047.1 conserved hypothetical protein [Trypanosoma vivax Y486]